MKVDHGEILEIFTINEVRFEEFFMDLGKRVRVVTADPLSGG
jgi:hypothetical protein